MQRLVDVAHQVHHVACVESSLSGVLVQVLLQDLGGFSHHPQRVDSALSIVDHGDDRISDIGAAYNHKYPSL